MRSLKVTLCASAAAVAVAALAPVAYAADGRGVTVTPSTPAPGTDITLRVTGCSATTATAASAAFVTDAHLSPAGTEAGTDAATEAGSDLGPGRVLTGETRVRTSVPSGAYDVRVACAGSDVTGHLTVAARSSGLGPDSAPLSVPSVPASPVAPVRAGGGGTTHRSSSVADTSVDDAHAAGPGTAQAVTGLVLAGVAAVAVALRSVRRGHGTD